ncbi:MAG: hypothetical protein AAB225_27520 [Acidobacteriota bacterium]
MFRLVASLLLCAAATAAQPSLGPPSLGCLRDEQNRLRPVLGVAANFMVGEPWQAGVVAAACSGRFALVKLSGALLLLDESGLPLARWDAPAGPALFAFAAGGDPSLVWFPRAAALYRWRGGLIEPVAVQADALGPDVTAIAPAAGDRMMAIMSGPDGLWLRSISLATGQVEWEERVHPRAAPALLRPDGTLLLLDNAELVVRGGDSAERRIPLPFPASALEPLGEEWVAVGRVLALRLRDQGAEIYRLPEVGP